MILNLRPNSRQTHAADPSDGSSLPPSLELFLIHFLSLSLLLLSLRSEIFL